jgi:hypothetical protein
MMKAKRARVEVTNTLATEAQATYRHLQQSLSSSSRNLVAFVGKMSSAVRISQIITYHISSTSPTIEL